MHVVSSFSLCGADDPRGIAWLVSAQGCPLTSHRSVLYPPQTVTAIANAPQGYALIEYANKEQAEAAIKETDGTEFLEKKINT